MINGKYKLIVGEDSEELNRRVNQFLSEIDIRQIVKMETFNGNRAKCCAITYINIEDVRDMKLDMLIK